jgi:hypothetical protein
MICMTLLSRMETCLNIKTPFQKPLRLQPLNTLRNELLKPGTNRVFHSSPNNIVITNMMDK